MAKQTCIRLYGIDEDGLYDRKEDYDLEDFGGAVPSVGDRILDPGVPGMKPPLDRRDYRNRKMLEVRSRYFYPLAHGDETAYVMLVVSPRPVSEDEQEAVL